MVEIIDNTQKKFQTFHICYYFYPRETKLAPPYHFTIRLKTQWLFCISNRNPYQTVEFNTNAHHTCINKRKTICGLFSRPKEKKKKMGGEQILNFEYVQTISCIVSPLYFNE